MPLRRVLNALALTAALLPLTAAPAVAQPAPVATARPGQIQAFQIGRYPAFALKDGDLEEANDGKAFALDRQAEAAKLLAAAGLPADRIHFSIQPLLVRAGGRVILFDTGVGTGMGPAGGRLPASLAAAGVDPAAVTDIFISHTHGDHVGGLVGPGGAPAFPKATIHMSAPEWRWFSGLTPAQAAQIGITDHAALVAAIRPKVAPFEPGAIVIPGVVKAVEVRGHTPGHSAYRITDGDKSLLYIGDSLHHSVISVQHPDWAIQFDTDRPTAAASRVALVRQLAASGQRLYAVHFPFPGVGWIERRSTGDVWVPAPLGR